MRLRPGWSWGNLQTKFPTALHDLSSDPHQLKPINDAVVEQRMIRHMTELMKANDAPSEQYQRLGL